MTHAELVERAHRWLKAMGCAVAFTEMTTNQGENPDAIGWRNSGGESFLVECKASRGDFLADRHKPHRRGFPAMGHYRYFMCKPGLIKPEDLPPKWGLLWVYDTRVDIVAGKHPRRHDGDQSFAHEAHRRGEMQMLWSALNRLRLELGDAEFRRLVHMPYSERKRLRPEIFERRSTAAPSVTLSSGNGLRPPT